MITSFFLYVCAHACGSSCGICAYADAHVHICSCDREDKGQARVLVHRHHLSCFLSRVSHWPRALCKGQAASPRDLYVSTFLVLRLQTGAFMSAFFKYGFWGQTQILVLPSASTLPTELFANSLSLSFFIHQIIWPCLCPSSGGIGISAPVYMDSSLEGLVVLTPILVP